MNINVEIDRESLISAERKRRIRKNLCTYYDDNGHY